MRKTYCIVLALAAGLVLPACDKDDIVQPDPQENTVAGDDSAGGNIDTNQDDDDVAKTTFARTVTVTFAGSGATVTGATADFTVSTAGAGVTIK